MTPLQIVRSKEPTHDNMQIELLLLRAGAKDDILGNNFAKEFFEKCNRLRLAVAMDEYYTYLSSLYWFSGKKRERIDAAKKIYANTFLTMIGHN